MHSQINNGNGTNHYYLFSTYDHNYKKGLQSQKNILNTCMCVHPSFKDSSVNICTNTKYNTCYINVVKYIKLQKG